MTTLTEQFNVTVAPVHYSNIATSSTGFTASNPFISNPPSSPREERTALEWLDDRIEEIRQMGNLR